MAPTYQTPELEKVCKINLANMASTATQLAPTHQTPELEKVCTINLAYYNIN